jgi:hypothetical protein
MASTSPIWSVVPDITDDHHMGPAMGAPLTALMMNRMTNRWSV